MKDLNQMLALMILLISLTNLQVKADQNFQPVPAGGFPNSKYSNEWLNVIRDDKGNKIISDDPHNQNEIPEDPETDALQRKIFNGAPGTSLGISVSSAGDVNGDGYDDIIVGANQKAFIFFGGINMNTTPDVVLTGEGGSSEFGISVACAGDVNGDGFSDVIVGDDIINIFAGKTYIFFGGQPMNNIVDITLIESGTSRYGFSVSSAGDMNGDGYSDVIVGTDGSGVFIYFGGVLMNGIADIAVSGEAANIAFGRSVSKAGDVNGDGFADVIIGAPNHNTNVGRAYVYFGGALIDTLADVIMTGETAVSSFGSVGCADDVNGDGYSDVIVGAVGYNSFIGRAYIFYGGASMNNVADVIFNGEAGSTYFGNSVSSAGDINGDGYPDIIIGADNRFATMTGKAYVYFGGASMNNSPEMIFTGETGSSNLGCSVSSAGDVNGDGYCEIIIGAFTFNSNSGRVYMYDYFMKNEIIPEITLSGNSTGIFGTSVSSAGDVNGDGYSDVIVGAPNMFSNTGRAYIFFGGTSMDNTADLTLAGEASNNFFGISVASAGDVNNDGYSDVIVGASGYNTNIGRAYIYFGGPAMNNVADVTMTGGAANNSFGCSVSSAGDVNADGFSDVVIGATGYLTNTGRAYVYLGGEPMNIVADVTMSGEATANFFGVCVSSAGDVNGDGYSDVIVGADGHNSSTGKAYNYYGATNMDNIENLSYPGSGTSNYMGHSVSSAGDVNGDGYSDVIIGAYGYNSSTGRAYVLFGGTIMDNSADVIITGETSTIHFGASVSSAGDMNGDGYSDFIVGDDKYNSFTGRSYVFFGGASVNSVADLTMTGETTGNNFGVWVASAGDVNGDGYSDVISGAYGYNSNNGRAYIYTGSAISVKPILMYVKDVPNDQGGKVNLKWARSGLDVQGNSVITDYLIQRSFPPSGGNFSWQNITSIPATHESFYSYVDNTPSDSTSNNSGTMYYRITARTSDINQSWRSAIVYGRSIDNISPQLVSPFNAFNEFANVRLTWKKSSAPDLLNYILYRSSSPTIDPYTETPLSNVTDSTYLDTFPLNGVYYYFIVAQDVHNNYSPVAVVQSPNITVNLTMFIEGFYDAGSNSQISDTINVFLRNVNSPFTIVDSARTVVSAGGNAVLKFGNAPDGTYYIVIRHRNSIETWSSSGILLSNGNTINFNLASASSQAYGNNIKQIDSSPLRFGIYSGDGNQDGIIDVSDIVDIFNDALNFNSGYINTDVNGDEFVDVTDLIIAYNNSINIIGVITP